MNEVWTFNENRNVKFVTGMKQSKLIYWSIKQWINWFSFYQNFQAFSFSIPDSCQSSILPESKRRILLKEKKKQSDESYSSKFHTLVSTSQSAHNGRIEKRLEIARRNKRKELKLKYFLIREERRHNLICSQFKTKWQRIHNHILCRQVKKWVNRK